MLPLATVKSWMKVTVDTYDDQIQALMDRAQALIEREVCLYFGPPRATEEILDGTGTTMMFIRQAPVDPSAVVLSYRTGVTDDWSVVDSDDYEISDRGLFVPSYWTRGKRNFKAAYQEGYNDPPGDVAQLFLDLVTSKWKGRGDRTDLVSETIGDYSYTRADLEKQSSWSSVKNNWGRKRI